MTSKDKEASESLKLGTSCGPSNLVEQGTSSGPCKPVAMVISSPLLAPVPDTEGPRKRMLVLDDVRALQQAVGPMAVGSGAYRWGQVPIR